MKQSSLIWILVGLAAAFFLLFKKSATATVAPTVKGSNAVAANSLVTGSALLVGDLASIFTGQPSSPSNSPFLGGGSPSIVNVQPSGFAGPDINSVTGAYVPTPSLGTSIDPTTLDFGTEY